MATIEDADRERLDGASAIPRPPDVLASLDLSPRSPYRPPAWRWERAGMLAGGARRERWDDAWVGRARRFRQALARPNHRGWSRRSGPDPAFVAAHELHNGDSRRRWEVQVRILAGQGDGPIAARFGVGGEVVAAYEATFFSARDRLGCPDWVSLVAIGVGIVDVESLWKRFAYAGAPAVLDALIDYHDAGYAAPDPMARPALATPARMAMIAASIEATPRTARKVLLLDALARENQARDAADRVAAVSGPVVAMGVEALFAAISGADAHGRCAGDARVPGETTPCAATILPSTGWDEDRWFRATG